MVLAKRTDLTSILADIAHIYFVRGACEYATRATNRFGLRQTRDRPSSTYCSMENECFVFPAISSPDQHCATFRIFRLCIRYTFLKRKERKMEYTLQDAFETLKESQMERQKEIEDLTNVIPNNFRQVALQKTCNSEDVKNKQHKLCKSLLNQVLLEEPKDYPVPRTSDLHAEVLTDLEKEVQNAYQLFERMKTQHSDIKDDIS